MKNVKKMLAVLSAVCTIGANSVMPASASYDACDVNHDGSVDLLDLMAVNRHLMGAEYFTNYNQLDANRSHTIDATDANCVMSKVLGRTYSACYIRQYSNAYMQPVNMPAVSSTITLDDSVNQTNSREYVGYSYLTHQPIPEYTLTATMANVNATPNPRNTWGLNNGIDDRGVAHGYENTGIVYIRGRGTGFIVGDHQIATAAHCVVEDNVIIEDLVVSTYDRSGAPVEDGDLNIVEIHIPQEYTNECSEYDYALITVEDNLSQYVHFDIGSSYNMTVEASTIPLHVTGCPVKTGDSLEINNDDKLLYTHYGRVYGATSTTFLWHTVDISSGQSGAPVYTIIRERYNNTDYYTYTALAVNTGGISGVYNQGTLMTKYHQQFYNNNPYAHYE